MTTKERILKKYLKAISDEMIKEQQVKGMRASGESAKSLTADVQSSKDGMITRGVLSGASYWEDQEKGGEPVSSTNRDEYFTQDEALEWMKQKGIAQSEPDSEQESIAFLISRKVNRFGWRKGGARVGITAIIERNLLGLEEDLIPSVETEFTSQIVDAFKLN